MRAIGFTPKEGEMRLPCKTTKIKHSIDEGALRTAARSLGFLTGHVFKGTTSTSGNQPVS